MADKIQNAYETSKNIYDDVITQRNIFSKLYIKLFWSGTAVFTENKWISLKNAHMNSTIVEYIEGIEVIKAFGRVGTSYEKYAKAILDYKKFVVKWLSSIWITMKMHTGKREREHGDHHGYSTWDRRNKCHPHFLPGKEGRG